jgi:hypothetical protein
MLPADSRNTALFITIPAGFPTPFDLSAVNTPDQGEFSMDAIRKGRVSTAYCPRLRSSSSLSAGSQIYRAETGICHRPFAIHARLVPDDHRVISAGGNPSAGPAGVRERDDLRPCGCHPHVRRRSTGEKPLGFHTAVCPGLSMGLFPGGLLTGLFGWRSIFAVNGPMGLFADGLTPEARSSTADP